MGTRIIFCAVTALIALGFMVFGHPHIAGYIGLVFLGAGVMVAGEIADGECR